MEEVTLKARLDGFRITIPRSAISGIEKMTVEEGGVVNTECSKGLPLFCLTTFLTTGQLPDDQEVRWDVQLAVEVLQVAHYYQLEMLIKLAIRFVKRFIIDAEDARYVYMKIETLHMNNSSMDPNFRELFTILNRHCSTSVHFLTGEERTEINLSHVMKCFKKVALQKEDDSVKYLPISVPCYKSVLQFIIGYMDGIKDIGKLAINQKSAILETSCLLGYKELFVELLIDLHPTATPDMADDIYGLLMDLNCINGADAFVDRLYVATSELANPGWMRQEFIPLSLAHWIKDGRPDEKKSDLVCLLDDKDEHQRLLFLNRKRLLERLEVYLCTKPLSDVSVGFAVKYPLIVKAFLDDETLLRNLRFDYLPLCHLLQLGLTFKYQELYKEAYAALMKFHQSKFNEDIAGSALPHPDSISSLVRLVAADGASYFIDPNIWRGRSEVFRNLEKYGATINCPFITEKQSLAVFVQFILTNKLKLPETSDPERTRILVEFFLTVDSFLLNETVMELFDEFMKRVDKDSALYLYNLVSLDSFGSERYKFGSLKKKLEAEFCGEIYVSPHFLQLSVGRFVAVMNAFCPYEKLEDTIVTVWIEYNKERLQDEIPMPEYDELGHDLRDLWPLRTCLKRLELSYPELDAFLSRLEETYIY